jgi:armadillo repeat-containing protein 8
MSDALHASLAHSAHIGTRYAACQCLRALSRAVSVVRTSLIDSGLGSAAINVALRPRENEDRRVLFAALTAVCNLVIDFSPLKEVGGSAELQQMIWLI